MARYLASSTSSEPVGHKTKRLGGTAKGWRSMGSLIIKQWADASLADVVQLWVGAQDAVDQPLAVRVRAATAVAPFLR